MATMQILCAVLVSFSLAACSSSDESSGDSNTNAPENTDTPTNTNAIVKMFGSIFVSIETYQQFDRDYTETDIDAQFTEIIAGPDLTVDQFIDGLDASNSQIDDLLDGDTLGCIDSDEIEPLSIPESVMDPIGPVPFRDISAGEVLTITSPAGSWPELIRNDEDGSISYYHQAPVEGYPASGIRLDIPGNEFPPFENLQIPYIQPFLNMRAEFIGADPLFTVYWEPGVDANNEVSLRINHYKDTENRFIGVRCLVRDTGAFTVPAEFNGLFPESDPQSYNVFMNRSRTSYIQQDDVVVTINLSASGEI